MLPEGPLKYAAYTLRKIEPRGSSQDVPPLAIRAACPASTVAESFTEKLLCGYCHDKLGNHQWVYLQ